MPNVEVAEQAGVGLDGSQRPSEDVVIVRPNAVIVLDGATSLRADLRSGGWYAAALGGAMAGRLAADPGMDLADLLAASIRSLAREADLVPGRSPSSTVALLRWSQNSIDALVLGDTPVVAFGAAGPAVLADDRLATVPRTGGYRERLKSGAGYGDDHVLALRASGAALADLRNTEDGFWIAEADPEAAYQARTARWLRSEVDAVLVATDGVACGVDDYRIFAGWPEVLALATTAGPAAVLERVREAERSDPDGTRWPRPKPHDDQALVLVDFD